MTRIFLFLFFRLLTYINPTIFMDAKQQVLTLLLLRLFKPCVIYSSRTNHTALKHHRHHAMILFVVDKPIKDKYYGIIVYAHCLVTHLLCLKMIWDNFQVAWIIFNGFFTYLLRLKVIKNKSYDFWFIFNDLFTHLLHFKMIRGIPQGSWFPAHCLTANFLFFKTAGDTV